MPPTEFEGDSHEVSPVNYTVSVAPVSIVEGHQIINDLWPLSSYQKYLVYSHAARKGYQSFCPLQVRPQPVRLDRFAFCKFAPK